MEHEAIFWARIRVLRDRILHLDTRVAAIETRTAPAPASSSPHPPSSPSLAKISSMAELLSQMALAAWRTWPLLAALGLALWGAVGWIWHWLVQALHRLTG